jgi:hypothetical protein
MPLINFQTDLTNLPWGRDKRGGGNSNQPYVTKNIPSGLESDDLPVRSGPDFIIRGGLKIVTNAIDDVSRLFKMFIDTKNLSAGIGFIVKQNILSRTSVKTPASFGLGYAGSREYYFDDFTDPNGLAAVGGGNINQGVYTPISTLAQAVGNGLGLHANLLGIDPFSPMSGVVEGGLFQGDLAPGMSLLGLNTYEAAVRSNNKTSAGNRLVMFNNRANERGTYNDLNIYSYSGGPGSILGIGKTNIKFADQRTGLANVNGAAIQAGTYQVGAEGRTWSGTLAELSRFDFRQSSQKTVTSMYSENYLASVEKKFYVRGKIFEDSLSTGNAIEIGYNGPYQTFNYKVNGLIEELEEYKDEDGIPQYYSRTIFNTNPQIHYKNKSKTYTQPQLITKSNLSRTTQVGKYPQDFRKELYNVNGVDLKIEKKSSVISLSPNYRTKNKDKRLNMGQPGKQGGSLRDIKRPEEKNIWNYGLPANELQALDKITANPMYSHEIGADGSEAINDLVKFRIAAIDNNNPGSAVYMHFRAFIDSMDDSYTSTWNPVKYVGRGDNLYNYEGFNRTVNLSFTVAAQSKAELIPMYKKLNYLASTLAPSYNGAGFMRGNLVRLTIGGYLYEQPGFITSLTYTVPQESPWEIAINEEGGSDTSVQELPHVIKVTGLSFTPIHTFLPSKPEGAGVEETTALANNPTTGSNAGNQRFIALARGVGSPDSGLISYNDEYLRYEPDNASGGDNQDLTNE